MRYSTLSKVLWVFAIVTAMVSCSKEVSVENNGTTTNAGGSNGSGNNNGSNNGGGSNNGSNGGGQDCTVSPYRIGSVITATTSAGNIVTTAVSDTTINGKKYLRMASSQGSEHDAFMYVDATGSVWEYFRAGVGGSDLPACEMIYIKPGKPVGETWSYTLSSLAMPSMVSYKYTYTVVSNNITSTLNGITYNNCTKVKCDFEMLTLGMSTGSMSNTAYTWGCGVGILASEANGVVYSTTSNCVY